MFHLVYNRKEKWILHVFQAELKSLQDLASPSFTYARDLIKHNLVRFRMKKLFISTVNIFVSTGESLENNVYDHNGSGHDRIGC